MRQTEAGRVGVPLTVKSDDVELGDAVLVLTEAEATELHATLGRILAQEGSDSWA
ncbi:hypothetical protein ACFWIA_22795 [Streptomyces sp. NPDC127068]|uniref:hypothetical protein n=1 Tax=Streptomyces sp. NPDC127068 TaxID=3347127 RepID=UPI003656F3BB